MASYFDAFAGGGSAGAASWPSRIAWGPRCCRGSNSSTRCVVGVLICRSAYSGRTGGGSPPRSSRTPNFSVLRRNAGRRGAAGGDGLDAGGWPDRPAPAAPRGVPKRASTSLAGTVSVGTYNAARTASCARYSVVELARGGRPARPGTASPGRPATAAPGSRRTPAAPSVASWSNCQRTASGVVRAGKGHAPAGLRGRSAAPARGGPSGPKARSAAPPCG